MILKNFMLENIERITSEGKVGLTLGDLFYNTGGCKKKDDNQPLFESSSKSQSVSNFKSVRTNIQNTLTKSPSATRVFAYTNLVKGKESNKNSTNFGYSDLHSTHQTENFSYKASRNMTRPVTQNMHRPQG